MGSVRELLSTAWAIATSNWYWTIVVMASTIMIAPFVLLLLILRLPTPLNLISTLLIVAGGGVAAGYKDWRIAKEREEEQKIQH